MIHVESLDSARRCSSCAPSVVSSLVLKFNNCFATSVKRLRYQTANSNLPFLYFCVKGVGTQHVFHFFRQIIILFSDRKLYYSKCLSKYDPSASQSYSSCVTFASVLDVPGRTVQSSCMSFRPFPNNRHRLLTFCSQIGSLLHTFKVVVKFRCGSMFRPYEANHTTRLFPMSLLLRQLNCKKQQTGCCAICCLPPLQLLVPANK